MRAERRRAGRRVRKMRRVMKRQGIGAGYLFIAPIGSDAAWPQEWFPLGATAEGFRWPDGWVDMEPGDSITTNEYFDPIVFTTTRQVTVSWTFDEIRAAREHAEAEYFAD